MTWSFRAARAALNTRLWALHTRTMEVTLGIVWVRIVQGLGEFAYWMSGRPKAMSLPFISSASNRPG